MALSLIVHIMILIEIASSYWLSENRLSWMNASNYCETRCNSNLSSIHNINDYLEVKYLIDNSSVILAGFQWNVWIGLNKLHGSWGWSDNSPFDFGNNLTGGSFPWQPGEPNNGGTGEQCVDYRTDKKWNDAQCVIGKRFLCNSCEGVLDKYIVYKTSSSYEAASSFCENTLGTSLASIHSDYDMTETQYLCEMMGGHCWIGLNRVNNISQFKWSDHTFFDYGFYGVSPGDYPWGINYDGDEYCVEISDAEYNYRWNDESCNREYWFLCNKPNELCYSVEWQPMYSPHSDIIFNYNECNAKSVDYGAAIISNKRWNNNNWPLLIHYTFIVHNKNINGECEVGIIIYHHEVSSSYYDICDYYFIAFLIDDNNNAYFVIDKVRNGVKTTTKSSSSFTMKYDRYYRLELKLMDDDTLNEGRVTIEWNIYHGGGSRMNGSFSDHDSDQYGLTISNKYVGISNKNANITAKSLFISGTADYLYHFGSTTLNQCSLSPTNNPTFQPTTYPSYNPSVSPTTAKPTNNPTDSPTVYPSVSPTNNPSVSPTTATPTTETPTTSEPTTAYPTTAKPKNNYTITIETGDDSKLDKDKIETIIIAKLNITAGDIISTTIKHGTVTIQISVPSDGGLDGDIIESKVEEGLQKEYDDIDVSVKKTDNNSKTQNEPKHDPLVLILIIVVIVLLIGITILFVLYIRSKRNNKRVINDENGLELTATAISKVGSTSTMSMINDVEGGYDDPNTIGDTAVLPEEMEQDDQDNDGKMDEEMYTAPIKGAGDNVTDNVTDNGGDGEDLYLKANQQTPQQPITPNDDNDDEHDQMYEKNITPGNTRK